MDTAWIFFYGTFMSVGVLRDHDIQCEATIPAKLDGYELTIRPRVNLTKNESSASYGGLAHISHQDISRLYQELDDAFGITYFPYAVMADLADGNSRPALCYIAFDIPDSAPDRDYIIEMARCAKELEAPQNYIDHIISFI